jgi:hypothetical protein
MLDKLIQNEHVIPLAHAPNQALCDLINKNQGKLDRFKQNFKISDLSVTQQELKFKTDDENKLSATNALNDYM